MARFARRRLVDRLGTPGWVPVTGLLLALAFPPFPFHAAAWVALVPLLARWRAAPRPATFLREVYAALLIAVTLGGHWVLLHADTLKALLAGGALLLLPLPFAAAACAACLVRRRLGLAAGLVALAAGWLAAEGLLVRTVPGASWLVLGYTQAHATPFNGIAELAGVGGLSLWVWLLNVAMFLLLGLGSLTARFAAASGAVLLVVAAGAYTAWQRTLPTLTTDHLHVAVAQPALRTDTWALPADVQRVQWLADLTDDALRGPAGGSFAPARHAPPHRPALIVWPEGALPVFPDARLQRALYARVADWTARRDVPLLSGAITRADTAPAPTAAPERTTYYNSALLFDGARPPQQYDKVLRVPLLDRVPLADAEGRTVRSTHTFGAGTQRGVLSVRGVPAGVLIGYEVWSGEHARRTAADGAGLLVVLSNPSWWRTPTYAAQQEAAARLRAIETRRAVVTASVSGGSGLTLPLTDRHQIAGWMEPRVLHLEVPLSYARTPYVRHGDVVYPAAGGTMGLLLALAALAGVRSGLRRTQPRPPRPTLHPDPL